MTQPEAIPSDPSPCWFVADITISDPAEYALYLKDAQRVFSRFNGRYLAVDLAPELLEGDGPPGRVVIIQFPSRGEFMRWYRSDDYQRILQHRLRGARCRTLLVGPGEVNAGVAVSAPPES